MIYQFVSCGLGGPVGHRSGEVDWFIGGFYRKMFHARGAKPFFHCCQRVKTGEFERGAFGCLNPKA